MQREVGGPEKAWEGLDGEEQETVRESPVMRVLLN